jgi:hypothetical protein
MQIGGRPRGSLSSQSQASRSRRSISFFLNPSAHHSPDPGAGGGGSNAIMIPPKIVNPNAKQTQNFAIGVQCVFIKINIIKPSIRPSSFSLPRSTHGFDIPAIPHRGAGRRLRWRERRWLFNAAGCPVGSRLRWSSSFAHSRQRFVYSRHGNRELGATDCQASDQDTDFEIVSRLSKARRCNPWPRSCQPGLVHFGQK